MQTNLCVIYATKPQLFQTLQNLQKLKTLLRILCYGRMILYVTILLKNNSSFELLFNRS
jgi:hypothetical protein